MRLEPRELIRRVRRIEIATRRAVEGTLSGQYHSVFRGRGMAFDEVRAYAPGDEVRSIDWKVSARMGELFVKRFTEERELTVVLLCDLSGSSEFGSRRRSKAEVAAELAGLVSFSAVANGDRVGLVLFTDRVERFVPPRKGRKHALRLVSEILKLEPAGRGTDLGAALEYVHRVLRRRAVVFLLSDFQQEGGAPSPTLPRFAGEGEHRGAPSPPVRGGLGRGGPEDLEPPFARALRIVARRHDVVPVELVDALEEALPPLGLALLEDPETGEAFHADLADPRVRAAWAGRAAARRARLHRLFAGLELEPVRVRADDADHVKPLLAFFAARARRLG
ncbi:DUF58 domain-containing protein [Anaeromyxobacter paludicola]|uniref:VWFA domain-containing protein n=1 Tax=Anaeromyxobacter paludicola TaxID=2918171 RepID=A0ABM7XEJ4_9BACT|nr:DUF58 domain-containing protein [Anaeromyxobacter paludicola]BDG10277.1 hypothetical protein AMPC_33900 [Anaeromyxobacter paludicola]